MKRKNKGDKPKQKQKKARIDVDVKPESKSKLTPLQMKMQEKLEGARFRWLNETLYTTDSTEAQALFEGDPSLFEIYHRGFARQVQKWPQNPVEIFVKQLKKAEFRDAIISDFGCGDALLAKSLKQKVYSFDLVAANDRVTACDIANVPLTDGSIDIAVFSLSLMGTNYGDFLREAYRVLRVGGMLKIAEVASRFDDKNVFMGFLKNIGFDVKHIDTSNSHFVMVDCVKVKMKTVKKLKGKAKDRVGDRPRSRSRPSQSEEKAKEKTTFKAPILKPCLYKKR